MPLVQSQHGYMNRFETWFVHNRARWMLQRFWEIPILQRLGMHVKGKTVLDVGCGNGRSTRELVRRYKADSAIGCDIDMRYVRQGRDVVDGVTFVQADATNMPWADGSFDVVTGFGLLHHVVFWQDAVAEIGRVLKSGGMYVLDDFVISGLQKKYHQVFDAPADNRFSTIQLIQEIERNGMRVQDVTHRLFGDVVFLTAIKA